MKTHADPTKEQQHIPVQQPAQKTPATGGAATIADHRSETRYQRQLLTGIQQSSQVLQAKATSEGINNSPRTQKDASLLASMQSHAKAKAAPVQRMAAKGSSRFRQIAAEMGAAYGVDTSGLKATHHSTFPARLHAEATIQGRNIHFAPGKDTDHNIRHEVAHAIDNALNGTPKGDRVVNGQMVDTTREQVVHGMVNRSRSVIQRNTSFLYPRSLSSNGVFQLKASDTEIDPNKLNVVGEDHVKSDKRRGLEKQYTRAIFGMEGRYWGEHEISHISANNGLLFGDCRSLRMFYVIMRIPDLIGVLIELLDKATPAPSSILYQVIKGILSYIYDIQIDLLKIKLGPVKSLESLLIDKPITLIVNYKKLLDSHLYNFAKNLEELIEDKQKKNKKSKKLDEKSSRDKLRSEIEKMADLINSYRWLSDESYAKIVSLFKPHLFEIEDLKNLKDLKDLKNLKNYSEDIDEFDVFNLARSRHMQEFAEKFPEKKGIWKVGDKHIYDLLQIEEVNDNYNRKYNLVNKESFDRILNNWRTCGLFCLPSGIFSRR